MEIDKLKAFVHVYECGSITEAAQASFISRQAMSKTIAQVEAELGQLFERDARGVHPTPLAEALYPHASSIVVEYSTMTQTAELYAHGQSGSMRLALESNAALTLPVDLVSSYQAARPQVSLTAYTLPADLAFSELALGRVDALVTGPPSDKSYEFDPILFGDLSIIFLADACPEVNATQAASNTDSYTELSIEALSGKTIFSSESSGYVERSLIPYLAQHHIDANIIYGYTDTALLINLMEAGKGGIFIETQSALQHFGGSRYAHITFTDNDAPHWEVGIAWHPQNRCDAIAHDFADFARTYIASAGAQPDLPNKDQDVLDKHRSSITCAS